MVRSDLTSHTGERVEITAWLRADGLVDSTRITEVEKGSRETYRTSFGEHSITSWYEAAGEVEQSGPVTTQARVRPDYEGSFVLLQLLARNLALATGRSLTLTLGHEAGDLKHYRFTRARDTLIVSDEVDQAWLALDAGGAIRGGRTREGDRLLTRELTATQARAELPGAPGWVIPIHPWLDAARTLMLDSLTGVIPAFYSSGSREVAVSLRNRFAEATRFYQDSLGASAALTLLVVNRDNWSRIFGPQFWGFAANAGAPGGAGWVVIQPATGDGPLADLITSARSSAPAEDWRRLDSGSTTPEALALRHMDMVVVHEYGHLLVRSGAIPIRYGQRWFQEFLATYLMYAFLASNHPELAKLYDAWDRIVLETARDPITDVNRYDNPESVTPAQLLWFYAATGSRARACYRQRGLDLIRDLSKSLNVSGGWVMPNERLLPILESSCPGFERWTRDMRSDPLP